MVLRLLILAWLLATAACLPIPTPPVVTLEEPPSAELAPLRIGEAVAVVSRREDTSRSVADCMHGKLSQSLRQNRVLTVDQTRDALFPWLEPDHIPEDDPAVRAFMARPAVAAKLRELRLRYLVVVDLSAEWGDWEGFETGLAGGAFGEDTARAAATMVDLEGACCRSGGAARASGIRGYAHLIIYGLVILSSLEGPACDRLSAALVQALEPAAAKAP